MKKKIIITCTVVLVFLAGKPFNTNAQFSLMGQVRTRTEYRDGFGTLNLKGSKSAFFTSQRTRLTFGYKWDRILFNVSAQDVRVWGQDASTINNADGNRLMIHEAWADVTLMNANDTTIKAKLLDNLSFKIGRQELLYDDSRLLGNLDWAQQARRHDALVLKALHKGWQVDLGLAFGQNNDNVGVTGTSYVPANVPPYVTNSLGVLVVTPAGLIPVSPGGAAGAKSSMIGATPIIATPLSTNAMNQQYKSLQFLYFAKKFGQTKLSALVLKDDFSKYRMDSVGSASAGYVYGRRYDVTTVNSRFTYGGLLTGTIGNVSTGLKKVWTVGAYFQSGKNKDGKELKAYHYTLNVMLQTGKFSFGPGYDYLSGNDATSTSTTDNRFDPLYGTPHKFWGFMDFFYVGTGSPVGGLQNVYFKTKFTTKDLFITLDAHQFSVAKTTLNTTLADKPAIKKNLGYEFDFLTNYTLNKFTTLELGYSFMAANNSMEYVKRSTIDKADHHPSWAYLMINIKPDFFFAKPVAIKPL